jgi:hypothetical protein
MSESREVAFLTMVDTVGAFTCVGTGTGPRGARAWTTRATNLRPR